MPDEFRPPSLEPPRPSGGWKFPLLVSAAAGALILGAILWLGHPASERPAAGPERFPPLTPEAADYRARIEIAGLELSRWQNFLGQEVTYLDGQFINHGPRTLTAAQLTIEFKDSLGQTVLRETFRVIGAGRPSPLDPRSQPLESGQTRRFRAAFEHIPASWNRAPPAIEISGLLLD